MPVYINRPSPRLARRLQTHLIPSHCPARGPESLAQVAVPLPLCSRTAAVKHHVGIASAHLALRMLPHLSKAPRTGPFPRLVIVASDMHYHAQLSTKVLNSTSILEALNDKELSKYAQSLLAKHF